MWESTYCVDFQGLWEEGNGFMFSSLSIGAVVSTAGVAAAISFFVVWPIDLARSFLVSDLLAVGHDLGQALEILAGPSQ